MTKLARAVFVVWALTALTTATALGAVSVSWTDAAGGHVVQLQNVNNPDYTADPLSSEMEYVWAATLNIAMDTPNPVAFYVTGDFRGVWGEVWDQVRIVENVKNDTGLVWTDFHVDVVDYDGEFYNMNSAEAGWSISMGSYSCALVADAPQYYIQPGDYFNDGIDFWANVNYGTGAGSLTFSKYPTYIVPEAGSLAGLLAGLVGLTAGLKRRVL